MDVPQGKETVTDREIIEIMRESSEPAFITSEVADMVGMTTEGARGRLEQLREEGLVYKKKPSSRTVLWWVYSDEREPVLSK